MTLQGHLRSMIFMWSERIYNFLLAININLNHRPYLSPFMRYGDFSVEKRTLSTPSLFNPKFENMFPFQ